MAVSVVRDALYQAHDPGFGHPECPERLAAIDAYLEGWKNAPELISFETPIATLAECEAIHAPEYVAGLAALRGQAARLDPDTAISPKSIDAAFAAAGASIDLATRVAKKEVPPGIALVRPPGHHAERDHAMGFCLLNNVAIAARALIDQGLAERVAIYDWDVHHGNGTQNAFYEEPSIFYASTHQAPFYPGTGLVSETGRSVGEGATFNAPLSAGAEDADLLEISTNHLAQRIRDFRPDFILISAGFDPYVGDPLGGFRITTSGFHALAARWRELAEELTQGRIAAVLEGGYDLHGIGSCVGALLAAWDGKPREAVD